MSYLLPELKSRHGLHQGPLRILSEILNENPNSREQNLKILLDSVTLLKGRYSLDEKFNIFSISSTKNKLSLVQFYRSLNDPLTPELFSRFRENPPKYSTLEGVVHCDRQAVLEFIRTAQDISSGSNWPPLQSNPLDLYSLGKISPKSVFDLRSLEFKDLLAQRVKGLEESNRSFPGFSIQELVGLLAEFKKPKKGD